MRKIFYLTLLFILISGCSKGENGNITILCEGEKIIRTKNGSMWDYLRTEKTEKEYVFVDKKLHPYKCEWDDRSIICKSDPRIEETINVTINIDRERGEVTDLFKIIYQTGSGTYEVFNGKCKKLDKKF
jgi:hypothetical protein